VPAVTGCVWKTALKSIKESEAAMNHSIYSADRGTYLKIVILGFMCACFVLAVAVYAHVGQLDLGPAPLLKPAGATVISGQMPIIR
jgi:hypothetical protein